MPEIASGSEPDNSPPDVNVRPEDCVCPTFSDTGGFRIADLCCPVHGIAGTDPGDGRWEASNG